jgi:hypothetical protein
MKTMMNDKGSKSKSKQMTPWAVSDDVGSIDAIIGALYEAVSFPPGSQPDYDRLRLLFAPDGRLIPPILHENMAIEVIDLETFISRSMVNVQTSELGRRGFHEKEISRITEMFGNIAHTFSTYEARYKKNDAIMLARGINSIQLANYKKRWWVLTVFWTEESAGNPIPEKYLGGKND